MLPSSIRNPAPIPAVHPVDAEFERVANKTETDECDRIIERVGAISDMDSSDPEDMGGGVRLSELTSAALRGFRTFQRS